MSDTTQQIIQAIIQKHPVVLFMKGTPESPYCGFSQDVARLLTSLKIDFFPVDVMQDDTIRQGIKTFSQWPTIPQLYVNQAFIGGRDIVMDMHEHNELLASLQEYVKA